ncbi:unnamed protein product [Rotaria sordida]|uniref:Uncharacterized protein n=2 Tax=Rotaria sordida TaxID=392033 RepID=A0A814I7G3_9BILA|nr:unnamed protein product [Rotaria sordida]
MLSTCSFNVVPCLETDFLPFVSSTYGLCYTFNAKLKYSNNDSIRYENKNGGDGNLKLGLYVHNHQYVPYVRDNVGIVSLVHDNTQLPLIEAADIELAPGRKHKLVDTLLASSILMNKYCSDCSQQCLITNFIIQISSLATPVEWQMYEIKGFVENSTIPLPNNWTTTWREHIRENYLAVNVVRETNIVENNTQTAIFGVVDILSNIGGQTGLWIGISFRSIMEVFEMLYRLICYQYFLIVRAVRKKKQIIIQ